MSNAEDRLLQWLRDAHAAEKQAETMLSRMAQRIEHYPELRNRIEQHVEETRSQADRVRQCIERRNGSTSTLKDTGASMLGFSQAISGLFVGDEVVKGVLASYSFEAMEIASYQILATTARQVGDEETAKVCEQIAEEEKQMADWLQKHIPDLTQQYLAREEAGETAKR